MLDKDGFKTIPHEQYSKYTADFILIPTEKGNPINNEFTESSLWKNQPAIKIIIYIIILKMRLPILILHRLRNFQIISRIDC